MRRYVFGTTTHDAEVQHGAPEWFYIFITWDVYTVYVYIRFFFRTHRTIITYIHETRIILQYAQKKYTCYNNNTRRYTPSSRFFRATREVHHGAIFFFLFCFSRQVHRRGGWQCRRKARCLRREETAIAALWWLPGERFVMRIIRVRRRKRDVATGGESERDMCRKVHCEWAWLRWSARRVARATAGVAEISFN